MVSFGHAVYLGIGGYAVAILDHLGRDSGFLHLACAHRASVIVALAIGSVSLRTRGVYFIMITLAFAQMVYFFAVSLEAIRRRRRPDHLAAPAISALIDLGNKTVFYYVVLRAAAAVSVWSGAW